MDAGDDVASGYGALAIGAWGEARIYFERALTRAESPEAFEGLGAAAWWLDDTVTAIEMRRRAFNVYCAARDACGAARVATALAWDHHLGGEHAICNGWRNRAHRLLEDLGRCLELGWLAILDAELALTVDRDPAAGEVAGLAAASLGAELAEVDLQMSGLAYRGLALVTRGSVKGGMRLLDEATAAALAGEITDPDASASCCCALIYACELICDYARAAEWCQRLKQVSDRWSYRFMISLCRVHLAGVLMWRGQWMAAEAELLAALDVLEATRPGQAAEGIVRLAQLRCRQGRFEEASELLVRTEQPPLRGQGHLLGLLGRAHLALERGDKRNAADLAERYLRAVGDENRMERREGLEVLAHARSATGDLQVAEAAAAELSLLAADIGTDPIRASACLAAGSVAAARGDHETARRWFEDAMDRYHSSGGVFEEARARLYLASTLSMLGRDTDAATEARAAHHVLRELGAGHAAAEAAEVVHALGGSPPHDLHPGLAHLTRREIEVFRLVARGLSNQVIADELFLSVRTVERHVGNIYQKLHFEGSTARASATAFAAAHGLT